MVKSIQISGKKLALLRESRDLTQEELAQMLDMSTGNISRLESLEPAGIYPRNFRKMATAMGIDRDVLKEQLASNGHAGVQGEENDEGQGEPTKLPDDVDQLRTIGAAAEHKGNLRLATAAYKKAAEIALRMNEPGMFIGSKPPVPLSKAASPRRKKK